MLIIFLHAALYMHIRVINYTCVCPLYIVIQVQRMFSPVRLVRTTALLYTVHFQVCYYWLVCLFVIFPSKWPMMCVYRTAVVHCFSKGPIYTWIYIYM